MKQIFKTGNQIFFSVLLLLLATVAFAFGFSTIEKPIKAKAATGSLNLYDIADDYTTVTTAEYGGGEWFQKVSTIGLGNEANGNAASYSNAIQLLVKGPFDDGDPELGRYYSAVTYDISAYDYSFFSVIVGNNNASPDGYSNHLTYIVMFDGVEAVRSSHALAAGETQRLSCAIPDGAEEIRLHAISADDNLAYGESNWVSPVLTNLVRPSGAVSLTTVPVSGNDETHENYQIGSATLNAGTASEKQFDTAIIGAIHGNYGNEQNPIWKFSADYDISDTNCNHLEVEAGVLFGRTENRIYFKILSIAPVVKQLAISPVMDGTQSYLFDIDIPEGTTKIQFWAQSTSNMKEFGNIAWCNPKLTYEKATPVLLGDVEAQGGSLTWDSAMPTLKGNITDGNATLLGALALDAGQTLQVGTHDYNWTFTPADAENFTVLKGTVSLTVNKKDFDLSGVSYDDMEVDYNGHEQAFAIKGTLPTGVTVRYENGARTAIGTTEVTVIFVVEDTYKHLYNEIPSVVATFTVKPVDYINAAEAAAEYVKGGEKSVSYTLYATPVNATISCGGVTLDAANYTIENDKLTLNSAYLRTLGVGEYAYTVKCDGGEFTFALTVSEGKGCSASLTWGYSLAAVAAMAVAVAVLTVRRKKNED